MKKVACSVCLTEFDAQRSTAKYCGARCRQRAKRKASAPTRPTGSLVEAVTAELRDANALGSYSGQLALELARQLVAPGATGLSSLSKELRTVMASALGGTTPPPAEGDDESRDIVDEVRERRERQAGAAAG